MVRGQTGRGLGPGCGNDPVSSNSSEKLGLSASIVVVLLVMGLPAAFCCGGGRIGGPIDYSKVITPGSLQTDSSALLQMMESLTNKTALMAPGTAWSGLACNGSDTSSWLGITCEKGRVVSISIAGLGLAGPFPRALGMVYGLRNLTLDRMMAVPRNRWTGTLPSEWGTLGYLENLVIGGGIFNVSQVFVDGVPTSGNPLPASWGSMISLKTINLKFRNLTGPLPVEWTSMGNMVKMDLSTNWLSGPLPDAWAQGGMFPNLEMMDLSCNELSGTLPASWVSNDAFPERKVLFLTANRFTGRLPVPGPVSSSRTRLTPEGKLNGMLMAAEPQLPGFGFCGTVPPGLAVYGDPTAGRNGSDWIMSTDMPPLTKFPITCPGDASLEAATDSGSHWSWPMFILALVASAGGAVIVLLGLTYISKRWKAKQEGNKRALLGSGQMTPLSGLDKSSGEVSEGHFSDGQKGSGRRNSTSTGTSWPLGYNSDLTASRALSLYGASEASHTSWDYISSADVAICTRENNRPWLLGEGSYGKVYKGLRDGIHEVAIKVFEHVAPNSANREMLLKEVNLLRSCRNSHVVQFQGLSVMNDSVFLLMEFMSGGDLLTNLQAGPACRWPGRGGRIALDIACGMGFLHSRGVIHLDLKSPNVLLSGDLTAKIADVGLSRMVGSRSHASQLLAGSFHWMAPEVMVYRRATYKADVFSFGVILWEICTGEPPKRGRLRDVKVPEEAPQEVVNLIHACLHQDFHQRPSAKEIILILRNILQGDQGGGDSIELPPDEAPLEGDPDGLGIPSGFLLDSIHESSVDPETLGVPDPAGVPKAESTPMALDTPGLPSLQGKDSAGSAADAGPRSGPSTAAPTTSWEGVAPPSPFSASPTGPSAGPAPAALSPISAPQGAPPSPFSAPPNSLPSPFPPASTPGTTATQSSGRPPAPPPSPFSVSPQMSAAGPAPAPPSPFGAPQLTSGVAPPPAPPSPFSVSPQMTAVGPAPAPLSPFGAPPKTAGPGLGEDDWRAPEP